MSGRFDQNTPGMVMPLDRLQSLTSQEGKITTVAVSNRGDVRDGAKLSDQVADKLKAYFKGQTIGVDTVKKDSIKLSKDFASLFTTFFLVFGLFSSTLPRYSKPFVPIISYTLDELLLS